MIINAKQDFILCVQMPNMPQNILLYPSEQQALDAVDSAVEKGIIKNKADLGTTVIHTVPGTTYVIMSKETFEKQVRQQQLMMGAAHPGPRQRGA